MILITSGIFLNSEFTSLFGQLPPSFLPVGNKRLYSWQLESLEGIDDRIVMTIPRDYILQVTDKVALRKSNVEILYTPPEMTLGSAIVYAINVCKATTEPIKILHGDTLCGSLAGLDEDLVLTGNTSEYYRWAEHYIDANGYHRFTEGLPTSQTPKDILCGFFSFANGGDLVECLSKSFFNFVEGLDLYSKCYGLKVKECPNWLDFGHVQSYYKSKSRMTTERAFNKISATPTWIEKSSSDDEKILAEANWYETLPRDLKVYTPQYLGKETTPENKTSYRLEYAYLSTLSELAVFGDLPAHSWQQIFSQCNGFISTARTFKAGRAVKPILQSEYLEKTFSRLEEFARTKNISLEAPTSLAGRSLPSLQKITETIAALIPNADNSDMTVWHGDMCYSNIFYDFRANQIKLIDPRGRLFSGKVSSYGDLRYDVAKLSHSVTGRYDFIVANVMDFKRSGSLSFDLDLPDNAELQQIEKDFLSTSFGGYIPGDDWARAMSISLFLSMLPLHYENETRQFALLANALRLFSEFD